MKELVLIGKLDRDDYDVGIIENKNYHAYNLAVKIGDFIEKDNNKLSYTYDEDIDNDLGYRISTREDNVQLRYYISEDKINSKEEIEKKYLEKISGSIDISVQNVGYSEYTITGYETENFKLGGHDLEKIFSNYIGKYVCIIVEKCKELGWLNE